MSRTRHWQTNRHFSHFKSETFVMNSFSLFAQRSRPYGGVCFNNTRVRRFSTDHGVSVTFFCQVTQWKRGSENNVQLGVCKFIYSSINSSAAYAFLTHRFLHSLQFRAYMNSVEDTRERERGGGGGVGTKTTTTNKQNKKRISGKRTGQLVNGC